MKINFIKGENSHSNQTLMNNDPNTLANVYQKGFDTTASLIATELPT